MQSVKYKPFHWMLAILIVAPVVVYALSVVRDGFVSIDDSLLITANAAVQHLSPFTVWHVFTSYDPELYIPLTLLSYQIEWAIVGAQPLLFHLDNLLLHTGTSLLLFLFLRRIFSSDRIAFLGALLFAVHPVHSEAVAWAAARKDVLSGFFFVASLCAYEFWREEKRRPMPWQSLALFLLALLSKVTAAPLPVLLLLLDWRRAGRITFDDLREKLPYFALSILFIIIALFGKAKGISALGPWKTLLLSAKSVTFTLGKILWPAHLSVIYAQQTPVTIASPEFFIPVLLTAGLLILIVMTARRLRNVSVGLMFFLLLLIPNFANFWKNNFVFFASDRYAYLPSIGIIMILCALVLWVTRIRSDWKAPVYGGLGLLSFLLMFVTFRQTHAWENDIALYQNVLRWYPDSVLAANNFGDALVKAGNMDEAMTWFTKAAHNDPSYVQAMVNAGNVERERGKLDDARMWYERGIKAISSQPRIEDLAPHYLLGELLIGMGKTDEGLSHFRTSTELLPFVSEPYYNWGLQLQKLQRNDEAISLFKKAVSLRSDDLASRYHLAGLYAEEGRLPEAVAQLAYIVGRDPAYEKASAHLADIRNLLKK